MKISPTFATNKALAIVVLFLGIAAASLEPAIGVTTNHEDLSVTRESRALEAMLEVKHAEWAGVTAGFENWLWWCGGGVGVAFVLTLSA